MLLFILFYTDDWSSQCFIQQKNRHFVYSLIVTEKNVQFDRSESFHTVKINIHEEAATFVRIVLARCSDDRAVGFDTSIYWENDQRYLRSLDEIQQVITYTLSKRETLFYRRTSRGRGTICRRGVDNKNRAVIIKDAWRSKDRSPEWEKSKGLGRRSTDVGLGRRWTDDGEAERL